MRPCLLVPCYQHGRTLPALVDGLSKAELPCFVVDDGSDAATRAVLASLAADRPWLHVLRHAENRGKGAALRTGYRTAAWRGFTHAIQLDADGQHDPADVPRVLAAVRVHPDALVLGVPIFDASAPRLRLASRQISRVFVWLATLSTAIRDPLCGFRGMPLGPTVRVLDRVCTGDRMDFDPEIAVRLYWDGVPVVSVDTPVVYDPDGLSHFDVVRDDLRLAWLYTRLVGGMLWRAPWLLRRRR